MAGRPVPPEALETVPTAELLNELKRRHHLLGRPPVHMALLGPPCVGKRTQAEALRRAFGICRISGSDLLAAGAAAGGSSDEGAISALTDLLDRPQCRRGFVLEGFPTTAMQAKRMQESLERQGKPSLGDVVFLDAEEGALLERCRGRMLHEASGRLYHEQFKPPAEGCVDDFTGEPLTRTSHDQADFQSKCNKFREDVGLLKEFFKRTGLSTHEVNATAGGDVVSAAIADAMKK
mmetsp:Transcript_10688/g.26716  ORF Transcript_10688/g.26716 Transcript_10688/m.26716 type:complete len:235 (-) Transcript_10688:29-733(-)